MLIRIPSTRQTGNSAESEMSLSILEDPAHIFQFDAFFSWFIPISDDLLTTTSALVEGSNATDRDAGVTAKATDFSSQFTDISLRISDIKAKIETERKLRSAICQVREEFRDQLGSLLAWLQSCERADALEDACLAGDFDTASSVMWSTRAVRSRCMFLIRDMVVSKLHLMKCMERMADYAQQHLGMISELMDFKDTLICQELASLKHQRQQLSM